MESRVPKQHETWGRVQPFDWRSVAVASSTRLRVWYAGAAGQLVTIDCLTIQDVATLHEALGIDVAASGLYGPVSASAKVKYAQECDFSSFSTYVLVRVSVQNAFRSFDDPVFAPDAADLLRDKNTGHFRERLAMAMSTA